MIITDKHGNMIDTVEMVENECYTIEDIEHVVQTDIYFSLSKNSNLRLRKKSS